MAPGIQQQRDSGSPQALPGVTPGMSHRYATRTAAHEAAFFLPHLRPGMSLLDCGCGPGTITLGLAEAVAPGQVVGIDVDPGHIESARSNAAERGISNVRFEVANIYELPFPEGSFDAAFENSVFIHLRRPVSAAREVRGVLKPGGVFASRDTCIDGYVIGNGNALIRRSYSLFYRWHKPRGSDLKVGKRLPAIFRQAGFVRITPSAATGELRLTPEAVAEHSQTFQRLFSDGALARVAIEQGWAD